MSKSDGECRTDLHGACFASISQREYCTSSLMRGEKILEEGLSVNGACEGRRDEWTRQVIVNVESMYMQRRCPNRDSWSGRQYGCWGCVHACNLQSCPTLGPLQCGLGLVVICGFAVAHVPSASGGHVQQLTLVTKHQIFYAPHSLSQGWRAQHIRPIHLYNI